MNMLLLETNMLQTVCTIMIVFLQKIIYKHIKKCVEMWISKKWCYICQNLRV